MVRTRLVLAMSLAPKHACLGAEMISSKVQPLSILRLQTATYPSYAFCSLMVRSHLGRTNMASRLRRWLARMVGLNAPMRSMRLANNGIMETTSNMNSREAKKVTPAGLMTLWRPFSMFSTPYLEPAHGNYTSSAPLITHFTSSNTIITHTLTHH